MAWYMANQRVDDARALAGGEILKWAAVTFTLFAAVGWMDRALCRLDFRGIAKC